MPAGGRNQDIWKSWYKEGRFNCLTSHQLLSNLTGNNLLQNTTLYNKQAPWRLELRCGRCFCDYRYVQCKRELHVYSWLLNIIYSYRVRCIYVPKSSKRCILLVVHVYFILNAYMYLNLLQINIFFVFNSEVCWNFARECPVH